MDFKNLVTMAVVFAVLIKIYNNVAVVKGLLS